MNQENDASEPKRQRLNPVDEEIVDPNEDIIISSVEGINAGKSVYVSPLPLIVSTHLKFNKNAEKPKILENFIEL